MIIQSILLAQLLFGVGLTPIPIEPVKSAGKLKKKKQVASSLDNPCEDQLSTNLPALLDAFKDPVGFLACLDHSLSAYADRLSPDEDGAERPGPESIVAVLSTTSCFSPRVPDR